jgi:hypothetical protein
MVVDAAVEAEPGVILRHRIERSVATLQEAQALGSTLAAELAERSVAAT